MNGFDRRSRQGTVDVREERFASIKVLVYHFRSERLSPDLEKDEALLTAVEMVGDPDDLCPVGAVDEPVAFVCLGQILPTGLGRLVQVGGDDVKKRAAVHLLRW